MARAYASMTLLISAAAALVFAVALAGAGSVELFVVGDATGGALGIGLAAGGLTVTGSAVPAGVTSPRPLVPAGGVTCAVLTDVCGCGCGAFATDLTVAAVSAVASCLRTLFESGAETGARSRGDGRVSGG